MKRILIFILGAGMLACSPKDIESYRDTGNNVYFDYEENRNKLKFVHFSFYDTPAKADSLVEIPVRISGPRVGYARTFKVAAKSAASGVTIPIGSTYAQLGRDFELEDTGTVPAGEGVGYVKLTINNSSDAVWGADKWTFVVQLDLLPSKDFGDKFSGGAPSLNTATVRWSRRPTQPDWWNGEVSGNWVNVGNPVLGEWSSTAEEIFRVVTGMNDLGKYDAAKQMNVGRNAINSFTAMMKNPAKWATDNPSKGSVAALAFSSGGFTVYELTMTGTGNKYRYRDNTTDGRKEWENKVTGTYSIFY